VHTSIIKEKQANEKADSLNDRVILRIKMTLYCTTLNIVWCNKSTYGEPQNQLYTTAITPTLVPSPRYLQLILQPNLLK
jgi:hypothetical protein